MKNKACHCLVSKSNPCWTRCCLFCQRALKMWTFPNRFNGTHCLQFSCLFYVVLFCLVIMHTVHRSQSCRWWQRGNCTEFRYSNVFLSSEDSWKFKPFNGKFCDQITSLLLISCSSVDNSGQKRVGIYHYFSNFLLAETDIDLCAKKVMEIIVYSKTKLRSPFILWFSWSICIKKKLSEET